MNRRIRATLLAVVALAGTFSPARAWWNPNPFDGGVFVGVSAGDPVMIADGAGGAYLAWSNPGVWVQRLDAQGNALWAASGVQLSTAPASNLQIVAVPGGGSIVAWTTTSTGANLVVRARRVDANGSPEWTSGGVSASSGLGSKEDLRAVSDGVGGVLLAWTQFTIIQGEAGPREVHIQRVSSAGTSQWGTSGVTVSAAGGEQSSPTLATDGGTGAIVGWRDLRSGGGQLFFQKYDSAGGAQWTANGVPVTPSGIEQAMAVAIPDGAGGVFAVWANAIPTSALVAQHLSTSGATLWAATFGVPVCPASTGVQTTPSLVSDGAGGVIIVFDDTRGGSHDIYAQRMDSSGSLLWSTGGVGLVTLPSVQELPAVAADGAGGAIVRWRDERSGSNSEIYAQRVGPSGTVAWPLHGIAVSRAATSVGNLAIVSTLANGALVAWADRRDGTQKVYAQRIDAFGFLGDPAPFITSATDVLNDQGGWIRLAWRASDLDTPAQVLIDHYDVEHWNGSGWDVIATLPLAPFGGTLPAYGMVVASDADSSSPSSPFTYFRVKALGVAAIGSPVWTSPADSARSVDNLAPGSVPLFGVFANGISHLRWSSAPESDAVAYRLYRSDRPDFEPDNGHRIAELRTLAFDDPFGAPATYQLTVVDRNGNESGSRTWTADGFELGWLGGDGAIELHPATPNPAGASTYLVLRMPEAGRVELSIYDLAGRTVRRLLDGVLDSGDHRVTWDLRDQAGVRVSAGVYFAVVRAGADSRVRRILIAP